MPLQEMEDSLWRQPGDPELWKAIRSVWTFAARTADVSCLPRSPPQEVPHESRGRGGTQGREKDEPGRGWKKFEVE